MTKRIETLTKLRAKIEALAPENLISCEYLAVVPYTGEDDGNPNEDPTYDGPCCVVGHLAGLVGVNVNVLAKHNGEEVDGLPSEVQSALVGAGLTIKELDQLQTANDTAPNDLRKGVVLAHIDVLMTMPEPPHDEDPPEDEDIPFEEE